MVSGAVLAGKWPEPLKSGDRIRLISPAGPIETGSSLQAAIDFFKQHNIVGEVSPHAYERDGYLAGDDKNRLDDLMDALFDDTIQGVICTRGGYGTMRLLDKFPWDELAKKPAKPFIGFSDPGAFQTMLWQKADWASFSGLQAEHGFGDFVSLKTLEKYVSSICGDWHGQLQWDASETIQLKIVRGGASDGVFYPVCLSVLVSLIGTPFQPNLGGVILCIEDVGEAPYRIDRLFWQLAQSGICANLSGMILGSFLFEGREIEQQAINSVTTHFHSAEFPIMTDMPYGHFANRLTLPFGVACRLDADGGVFFD